MSVHISTQNPALDSGRGFLFPISLPGAVFLFTGLQPNKSDR